MTTLEKTRYVLGDKFELLPKGQLPKPRGFLAANAKRFAMIATKLAQTGEYTDVEEELEARREKEMVHPCARYGSLVNVMTRSEPEDLEEAKRNQIRAAKAIRDVSTYDASSLYSGK